MATVYAERLSTPRTSPTERDALRNVARTEPSRRLEVSIGEWVGEELLLAFERVARAYYATK
jgi:hypothetical protein